MCQILLLCIALFAFFSASAAPIKLANEHLQLAFDEKNGRLQSFRSLVPPHDFLSANSDGNFWRLSFREHLAPLSAADARSFRFEKTGVNSLRLVWENFQPVIAQNLKVEAAVSLDENAALSRWQIAVHNLGNLQLHDIQFPKIHDVSPQENECLAVPQWMGQVTAEPRELLNRGNKAHRVELGYPGIMSLQCAAFYRSNGPGFFLSCDDTNAFRKSFGFFGDGKGGVHGEITHLPESSKHASQKYELPYAAVIGTFQGDWFTAAEMYRSWATNQWWARESRLAKNINPAWVPQTALWVWNRGRSDGVLQPAIVLQKKLGLPVSVMWHWWHGCSYDVGFPEYLPPREGNESFTNAVARARKHDINAIVYMNQRLWGMTTKSWVDEGAEKFAVKGVESKVHPEVYNTFTKSACASMCMGTSFWRDTYAGLAQDAFTLGISGIYMDQACSSLACYDSAHGHPIGGGKYWMNGFRLLATDIRERASRQKKRDPIGLAGEGVGESWLPYLDLMLSLQVSKERYSAPDSWTPIPFFQAVYHPFAIQYGNYSSLTMPPYDDLWPAEFAPKEPLKLLDQKFSRQFYQEQARAFIWGQQPTIANFQVSHLESRAEEIAFVLRLAKLRQRALKYLLYGTFLRPPRLHAPEAEIDISRLSIYAGQRSGLTTFQKRVPLVLAGAWRAKDGNVAIAVVNLGDESFSGELTLDESYQLPRRAKIFQITENGRKSIGRNQNGLPQMKISLPGRGASVLEFTR